METNLEMNESKAMEDLWNRLHTWIDNNGPKLRDFLLPGATEEEIQEAETYLGVQLPEDVKASYRIHNGEDIEEWSAFFSGFAYLPLEHVKKSWQVWKELLDSGAFEGSVGKSDRGVRSEWCNIGWIPIASDGGGDYICVDLSPTAEGQHGQIIQYYHDYDERFLWAPSFCAWFEEFVMAVGNGRFYYDEESECLNPVEWLEDQ